MSEINERENGGGTIKARINKGLFYIFRSSYIFRNKKSIENKTMSMKIKLKLNIWGGNEQLIQDEKYKK